MAALAATGEVSGCADTVFIAEVGLDGRLRPISGVLPAVMAGVKAGYTRFVVAAGNQGEAALVPQAEVRGYASLAEVFLAFGADPTKVSLPETMTGPVPVPASPVPTAAPARKDMADIAGQSTARFAIEIAAAGAHHMMMVGPPGAGKTMLAERMPGILPDLSDAEAMEVTAIHSLGRVLSCHGLQRRPPFESPHHTSSTASIIGGGSGIPRPGAASRAHRGVLFLDEAPEYQRGVLEALREPLESGELVLHRSAGTASYPARFQLVMALNPCPCGLASGKGIDCVCTADQRRRYFNRLSQPLLDRVDLQLAVSRVSLADYADGAAAESSTVVAARVAAARAAQRERLAKWGAHTNAEMSPSVLNEGLKLPKAVSAPVDKAMNNETLTMRGHDRVLRVAWTLADLGGRTSPTTNDVDIALSFRLQERAS